MGKHNKNFQPRKKLILSTTNMDNDNGIIFNETTMREVIIKTSKSLNTHITNIDKILRMIKYKNMMICLKSSCNYPYIN